VRVEPALSHYSWASVAEPVYVVELGGSGAGERWRLLDAEDIEDVLDWARSRQRGRVLSISLEHQDEYGTSMLRLLGPSQATGVVSRTA